MKNAVRKYRVPFLALVGMMVLGLTVGGYILSHQRFYLPNWVPVLGTDFVDYKAEFSTSQAVTPGQGQTVNIAGVPVGEIASVDLVDGRAVVRMKIRRKYTPIYRNATALLRPKSGLNDMLVQLDPGTQEAGELPKSEPIPAAQTKPNVNLDEILSAVDVDTRNYLRLLIAGGGEAIGGQGKAASAALRRFAPMNRDLLRISRQLAVRRRAISRSITNFSRLMEAVGSKDTQLASLVEASNASLKAFADQDQRIREALREFPSTLAVTNTVLVKATKLANTLGPAAQDLRPGARALADSESKLRPMFKATTPIVKDRLRPVSKQMLPITKVLRPVSQDLASAAPDLTKSFTLLNTLLNILSYNPPAGEDGFGYYFAWVNHIGPQVFAGQDAIGPVRRAALLLDCDAIGSAEQTAPNNDVLRAIFGLVNPVSISTAGQSDPVSCAKYKNAVPGLFGR